MTATTTLPTPAPQVDADLKLKAVFAEAKMEGEVLQRRQREKELALRAFKAQEVALHEIMDTMPNLKYQVGGGQRGGRGGVPWQN